MKELKCDLFAEHSSSNLFDANTVRLCLSSFAHVLYNRLRQALAETPLSRACPTTLRLLKIGVRVRISARRIHVAMSGSCPDKTSFAAAWKARSDLTWFELRRPVTRKSPGMRGTGSARPETAELLMRGSTDGRILKITVKLQPILYSNIPFCGKSRSTRPKPALQAAITGGYEKRRLGAQPLPHLDVEETATRNPGQLFLDYPLGWRSRKRRQNGNESRDLVFREATRSERQ